MKPVTRNAALTLAALATAGTLTTQAGASPVSCTVTAQPWNTTQYALDVVHADGTTVTLLEQTYEHLEPTSWTVPASVVEVRWAKDEAGVFYDRLVVAPGECRFLTDYANTVIDGVEMPDSVTITPTPTPPPSTTSSTVPEPTTTAPPIVVEVATPTPVTFPTVDEPLTPAPTTSTVEELVSTPPAPRLPETGGPHGFLAWLGLGVVGAGAGLIGATRRRA